jgi:hypothetical protein
MSFDNDGMCDSCGEKGVVQRYEKYDDIYFWCADCNEEDDDEF